VEGQKHAFQEDSAFANIEEPRFERTVSSFLVLGEQFLPFGLDRELGRNGVVREQSLPRFRFLAQAGLETVVRAEGLEPSWAV
jgi:hypothetical protein